MPRLQRSYNESEVWLEQQMKSFWERTRVEEEQLSIGTVLKYWANPSRMTALCNCTFSDDWIGILFQRVQYLIRNQTLLGSEDDKLHQAKTILIMASLLLEMEASDITGLRDQTELDTLMHEYPIFYKGFKASQSRATMDSHILLSGFDVEEKEPAIDLVVVGADGSKDELHTFPDTTLREFIEFYKSMKSMPKATFRVKYMGRTLFLSSSGNQTLSELGVTHRSFITVLEVKPPPEPINVPAKPKKKATTKKSSNRKKGGGGKKSKKKRNNCNYDGQTKDYHKLEHSKRMSLLFSEADATFKEIRKRLSNLSLKKMPPKEKLTRPKKDSGCSRDMMLDPSLKGVGGKAGKVVFPLLVGEVENLYQSAKKKQNLSMRSIDLHGCSGAEAVKKLDSTLPSWVSAAMTGEHPFVIKVDVVVGGGNQVLSEVVTQWIRKNKQVANRPKKH